MLHWSRFNRQFTSSRGEHLLYNALSNCREDVGDRAMAIGDVAACPPITNPGLHARHRVGTDPFGDPECLGCDVLPFCNGGCAARRLRSQRGEPGNDSCSPTGTTSRATSAPTTTRT